MSTSDRPRAPGRRGARSAPAVACAAPARTGRPRHVAIVGAGIAGIACARTLVQAGLCVTVFEQAAQAGGRCASLETAFGNFDCGAQYFTVRDARFARAIDMLPGLCRRWSANSVQLLDAAGRVAATGLRTAAARAGAGEAHWVACPAMQSLAGAWSAPLGAQLLLQTRVTQIAPDALAPRGWQLHSAGPDGGQQVHAGFDALLLALPAARAQALLAQPALRHRFAQQLAQVSTAPCWTLMLAYPQAVRPGLTTLGPQWNAARSTHHRIAWLARESSKPGRALIERWTVQASPAWSTKHLHDDAARVQAKLLRAFAEVSAIQAEPAHAQTLLWRDARTTGPLGRSHLWDAQRQLGACGDWCLGHRLEDAFVSGLELALALL